MSIRVAKISFSLIRLFGKFDCIFVKKVQHDHDDLMIAVLDNFENSSFELNLGDMNSE
jgi:hypothetical protein